MFTASLNIEALKALTSGKDPVCGKEVGASKAAGASTFEGKMHYFCSPACKKKFDASPAQYVTKS